MGAEITVSPLRKSDIPQILEIENESQPEPWTERSFLEEIDNPRSTVLTAREVTSQGPGTVVSSNEIAGYICFWTVVGEIQILNIAVRKASRRRGIARKLIAFAIETGRREKAESVTLEVRESNLAARRLYEALGFKAVGKRPNYYAAGKESAILMELDIFDMRTD